MRNRIILGALIGICMIGCEPIKYVLDSKSKNDPAPKMLAYCEDLCDLLGSKMDGLIKHKYDNCFTCVCRPVDGDVEALPLCPKQK